MRFRADPVNEFSGIQRNSNFIYKYFIINTVKQLYIYWGKIKFIKISVWWLQWWLQIFIFVSLIISIWLLFIFT